MLHKTTAASREITYYMYLDTSGRPSWIDHSETLTQPSAANDWDWSATIVVNHPGHPTHGMNTSLDHRTWLAAMQQIVCERDTIGLHPHHVEAIAAVLNARTQDATDIAATQLDPDAIEAILTVAAFGEMKNLN